jgi:murein DD-endopeptidase MepM/ murein hydrolase activator NlpD
MNYGEMWRCESAYADRGFVTSLVTALCAVTLAGCATDGAPRILSSYNSRTGVVGMRPYPHMGVDFNASRGDPVIAAGGGTVVGVLSGNQMCGNGVIVQHEVDKTALGWTRYCHMEETSVRESQKVERGDVLGRVGTTGNSMGVPHLHLELCPNQPCRGFFRDTADPLPFIAGCFDPGTAVAYTQNGNGGKPRLVLTYPLRCALQKKDALIPSSMPAPDASERITADWSEPASPAARSGR